MARFRAGVSSASPLRIRLEAATGAGTIVEAFAITEDTFGSVGWPRVVRSELSGSLRLLELEEFPLDVSSGTALCQAYKQRSEEPIEETLGRLGSFNLPIRYHWQVPLDHGMVVNPLGSAVFLARTFDRASWSGYIVWEEM